jgi:hypothetical protein
MPSIHSITIQRMCGRLVPAGSRPKGDQMKAIPGLVGLIAGIAGGYGASLWLNAAWAVGVGFLAFVAATKLLDWQIRRGAERRALRDYRRPAGKP